jgi:DNA-binding IclR family transcriptional regulator
MPIQVIDRAVRIIRAVAQNAPISMTEISERVGLPVPTVARIAGSLVENGILQRLENRKYRLGARLLPLASSLDPLRRLLQIAHPHIERLTETTREDCGLAVLQGNEAIVVDWCFGPQRPQIIEPFAREVPLHCAFGVVLVAFQSADWRQRFLRTANLRRITSGTILDRNQLVERVNQTRRTGVYLSLAENVEDAGSLAVPVFDKVSRLVGALFVTAPLDRFTARHVQRYQTVLVKAGQTLSDALRSADFKQ